MTEMRNLEATYRRLREPLEALGLPYVFIGAMPVFAWGRPRMTADLDLLLDCDRADWGRVVRTLAGAGFQFKSQVGPADADDPRPDIAFFWSSDAVTTRADVFIAKTDFERAVLATARVTDVLGAPMRVASPEASIVYKLLASRSKDAPDVEVLFEARAASGQALDWDFLERWTGEWGIEDRLAPFKARYRR